MILTDVHLGDQEIIPEEIKILICDVDGTVSDLTHRRHYVLNHPKNWAAFNNLMSYDTPITHVIDTVNKLFHNGTKVLICSGREEIYKEKTENWLMSQGVLYEDIYMRGKKDYRGDDIVKKELLDQIHKEHGWPDLVFDDRDRVVKMWRENGIKCIQVNEGDF